MPVSIYDGHSNAINTCLKPLMFLKLAGHKDVNLKDETQSFRNVFPLVFCQWQQQRQSLFILLPFVKFTAKILETRRYGSVYLGVVVLGVSEHARQFSLW